jgi:hypothetical protein
VTTATAILLLAADLIGAPLRFMRKRYALAREAAMYVWRREEWEQARRATNDKVK